MKFQRKEKIAVKIAEEEETINARVKSRSSNNQMSQIYLQHWEKENLNHKNYNLAEKKPLKNEAKQIFKRTPFEGKKFKGNKPVKFKKKNDKITQESEVLKIEQLIAKNNDLKKELALSRRVCKELAQKLQYERDRKRIKREDFEMIQNVLKRYT